MDSTAAGDSRTASATDPTPAAPTAATPTRVTVIQSRTGWIAVDWREIWETRELLYFMLLREVKVRYKQTVLGVAWAVLQPLITMLIFTIIFGGFAKLPSDGLPYGAFVLAALVPWLFFSNAVTQASQSLVNQQQLLTKIYLPRVFVPAAPVGSGLIDLSIALTLLLGAMVYFGVMPNLMILMLPLLIVVMAAAALGIGLLLAALTVSYRDFRFVVPFLMQIWMYVSPVVYPMSMVPEKYHWLMAINPMVGVIDGFRTAFFGTPFNPVLLMVSSTSAIACLCFGMVYFRKTERRFADIA
jgi:lipopolysaccharide transport system permease protein